MIGKGEYIGITKCENNEFTATIRIYEIIHKKLGNKDFYLKIFFEIHKDGSIWKVKTEGMDAATCGASRVENTKVIPETERELKELYFKTFNEELKYVQ